MVKLNKHILGLRYKSFQTIDSLLFAEQSWPGVIVTMG